MVRLPFLILPRTVYDDQRRDLEAALKRNEHLQQLLLDLKLDGAQIVRANPEYQRRRRERPEIDLIDEALDEHTKTRRNPGLKRQMRNWADRMLAEHKEVAWIVERVMNWDRVDNFTDDDEDEEDRAMGLIA